MNEHSMSNKHTHTIPIAHFEYNLMKVIKFKFVMAHTEWWMMCVCSQREREMGICIYLIRLIVNVIAPLECLMDLSALNTSCSMADMHVIQQIALFRPILSVYPMLELCGQ